MERKYLVIFFVVILALVISCAPVQQAAPTAPTTKTEANAKPSAATPTATSQPKQEISADVKDLLTKYKTKVNSIHYNYRGPQTGSNFFEFYVKGTKIKYLPYRETKVLDKRESYDSIFIDKTSKTAQSYCLAPYCIYKGKKENLNYADVYISTIFDWIDSITQAKKVGEEIIDDRSTWKLDTNQGILWVDTFYGIPLKIESGGKTFKFEQLAVNSVQDSDVTPS